MTRPNMGDVGNVGSRLLPCTFYAVELRGMPHAAAAVQGRKGMRVAEHALACTLARAANAARWARIVYALMQCAVLAGTGTAGVRDAPGGWMGAVSRTSPPAHLPWSRDVKH